MRADGSQAAKTGGLTQRFYRRFLPVALAVGGVAVPVAALHGFGIVINETPSLPLGLYRKVPHRAVERGCLVLFELPGTETLGRPYARGRLIKHVAAAAGDRVTVCAAGVFVNGARLENSAPVGQDVYGQPLPRLAWQDHPLGPGELLLMSTHHPRSFDGRYFGSVAQERVLAVLTSVWTWDVNSR